MKKALFVVYSYHHFLVAVAKTCKYNYQTDIVFSNNAYKKGFEEFVPKVKALGLFNNVFFLDESKNKIPSKKNLIQYYIYELIGQARHFERETHINLYDYDEIFVFSDVSTIGAVLSHKKIGYHLLEDVVDSFSMVDYGHKFEHASKNTLMGRLFWLLNLGHMLYGNDDSCKTIEVNSVSNSTFPLPMHKVVIVDRNELIYGIPQEIKNRILQLFDINLNEITENSAILLTEALYTDGKVESEGEQLKVYANLIKKFLKDYNVVIKPHPRDNIDYSSLNCRVIREKFPVEILGFSDETKFSYAVSISSTSVNGLTFIKDRKMLGSKMLNELKG